MAKDLSLQQRLDVLLLQEDRALEGGAQHLRGHDAAGTVDMNGKLLSASASASSGQSPMAVRSLVESQPSLLPSNGSHASSLSALTWPSVPSICSTPQTQVKRLAIVPSMPL